MMKTLKKALAPHVGTTVLFNYIRGIEFKPAIESTFDSRGWRSSFYTLADSENGRKLIWEGPMYEFSWPRYPGSGGTGFVADIGTLAAHVPLNN